MDTGIVKFRQFWYRNLNLSEWFFLNLFIAQSNCERERESLGPPMQPPSEKEKE